jgi:hypothetical protein
MVHDLTRMGERVFEDLCRALAVHVLGPGIQAFGDGRDGGREASFEGRLHYPTATADGWDGYGVLQAKYRRVRVGTKDVDWLRKEIIKELDAWTDPTRKRVTDGRVPEYLIIATNVRLSSAARTGGIDRITTLLAGYADRTGLNGWALWDANQLAMYLNAYPAVSTKFAEFITSGDVLAKTLDRLDSLGAAPEPARPQVGQGQPGNERAFRAAYDAAGGFAVLGEATGEVYEDGPGWVQEFAGMPGRGPVVLCALHERQVTAVAADVWDAICSAGAGSGRLDAVGYPVVTTSSPALLAADAHEIRLAGGRWGPGRLIRQPGDQWRWEPEISFSFETRERDRWTVGPAPVDLRLRCAARIAWAADDLFVGGAKRRSLEAALPEGPLRGILAEVSDHLGLDATAVAWERTPDSEGHNDRRFASYRSLVPGLDGRTVLGIWARLQLPGGLESAVISMVDMRVDFGAFGVDHSQLNPARGRLSADQLQRFFIAAWLTVTRLLPLAAVDDPLAVRPVGPTTIELHLDNERAMGNGGQALNLLDMLDLSRFGEPPASPRQSMSNATTAGLTLDDDQVHRVVGDALAHLASGSGFLDRD